MVTAIAFEAPNRDMIASQCVRLQQKSYKYVFANNFN